MQTAVNISEGQIKLIPTHLSAPDVFQISFHVVARFNSLGFCVPDVVLALLISLKYSEVYRGGLWNES